MFGVIQGLLLIAAGVFSIRRRDQDSAGFFGPISSRRRAISRGASTVIGVFMVGLGVTTFIFAVI